MDYYRRHQSQVDGLTDELGTLELSGRRVRFTKGVATSMGDPAPDELGFLDDVVGFPTRATIGMRRTLTQTREDVTSPFFQAAFGAIHAKRPQWTEIDVKLFMLTTSILEVNDNGSDIFHEEKMNIIALILGDRGLGLIVGRVISKVAPLRELENALNQKGRYNFSETEVAELFKDRLKSEKMAAFARLANQRGAEVYPKMMNDLNLAVQTATRLGVTFAYPPTLGTVERLADETQRLAAITSVQNTRMAAQQKVRGLPAQTVTRQAAVSPNVSYGQSAIALVENKNELEINPEPEPMPVVTPAAADYNWRGIPEGIRDAIRPFAPDPGYKNFFTREGKASQIPTEFQITRVGNTLVGNGWGV